MFNKKKRQKVSPEQKKAMLTTFILLFPSLITTMWIANITFILDAGIAISAILLFFFQSVLIKNFVDGHYSIA